jgi:hypothetical protein
MSKPRYEYISFPGADAAGLSYNHRHYPLAYIVSLSLT